jgi:DNA-binding response OmpR family regulator
VAGSTEVAARILHSRSNATGMPVIRESVLIVDDDVRILRMIDRIMELEGYRVLTASSGEEALGVFNQEAPSLVLLDIMMPDMDGITTCRRIREFSQVPIIMVTAMDSTEEKVEGLDAGADDYVTKPLSSEELAARVRAMLRRKKFPDEPSQPVFRSGDLVVDFARHLVSIDGKEVHLTAIEYALLSCLARNPGRVFTSDQLLERIWGEEYVGATHILQVNIARIRQKLMDKTKNHRYISTRPGIGYMILNQT